MSWARLLLVVPLVACGCGGAGAVRALTKDELDYTTAVSKRVDAHQTEVEQLVRDLRRVQHDAADEERQKTLTAIAEAHLLESMKAPWASPSDSLQATQRAVILFHLYELIDQQRAQFEAAQTERDTKAQEIVEKYKKLAQLLQGTLANEKIVLTYVNQPPKSQIMGIVTETLRESSALSTELAKSDDPRLQKLATETQKATARVEKAKDALQAILESLPKTKK